MTTRLVRVVRKQPYSLSRRWQQHGNRREEFPWAWTLAATYAGSSFALSLHYLYSMDDVAAASYRSRTTAWGEERQLEGLDEIASWIDWSASSAGIDLIPKLVRVYRVEECVALGAISNRPEVRAVALEASADLTTNDELARRVCSRTNLREAMVLELERLAESPRPRTAIEWGELYSNRLAVLNALANATACKGTWFDMDPQVFGQADPNILLDRLVPALLLLLTELRDAYFSLSVIAVAPKAPSESMNSDEKVPPAGAVSSRKSAYLSEAAGAATAATKSSRLATWMAELQESAVKDVIAELIAVAVRVAHHVAMLDGGPQRLCANDENLELLANLAWIHETDAALHAIMTLRHAVQEDKLQTLDLPDDAMYLSFFDTWTTRSMLALHRATDSLSPLPLFVSGAWGAIRRYIQWHASSDVFLARATMPSTSGYYRSLGRALLTSSVSTAAAVAFLSTLYGPRGTRYEFRRSVFGGDSDLSQIAVAAAFISADLVILLGTLRVSPFIVTPFFVLNTLIVD